MIKKYFDRHFVYYIIIGSIATLIDTAIFYSLSEFAEFSIILSNCISITVGILISYFLNAHFNFKKHNKSLKRLLFFVVVLLMGMAIGTSLLTLFVEVFSLHKITAKILSVIAVGLFQYLFNSRITFRN